MEAFEEKERKEERKSWTRSGTPYLREAVKRSVLTSYLRRNTRSDADKVDGLSKWTYSYEGHAPADGSAARYRSSPFHSSSSSSSFAIRPLIRVSFFFFFFTSSSFPFLSNVFSFFFFFFPLRNYAWSRDIFGWQKTKRGNGVDSAVTRETRSMRHFAVKVARFSMEMLVLTYSRARIIGLSIISKENFSRLCVNNLDLYSFLSFFLSSSP